LKSPWVRLTKADGIGFCLLGSPFGAFDIDDCRDVETGAVSPWAMELVQRSKSYAEITPSGTGLRIIGIAEGARVHRKQRVNDFSLESYRNATRYITITGKHLPGAATETANIDALMDEVVAELNGGVKSGSAGAKSESAEDIEDIGVDDPRLAKLAAKWKALGHQGVGLAEEYKGDRSRALFAFTCECFRADIAESVIASCLMRWKIGEHIRESANITRTLQRTLERARQFVADSELFRMNEQHAVLPIGGKTRVATWDDDPEFPGRKTIVRVSPLADFKALHTSTGTLSTNAASPRPSRLVRGGSTIRSADSTTAACASCQRRMRTSSAAR